MDKMSREVSPVQQSSPAQQTISPSITFIEGVPYEVYAYFGITDTDILPAEKPQVREMYDYLKTKLPEPTLGNYMMEFKKIESKLGQPEINESRWNRVYRYIKLSKAIDEMELQRNSMERFRYW